MLHSIVVAAAHSAVWRTPCVCEALLVRPQRPRRAISLVDTVYCIGFGSSDIGDGFFSCLGQAADIDNVGRWGVGFRFGP